MPSPSVEVMINSRGFNHKKEFNPHSSKKYPNRRQAAAMSAIGGVCR